MSERDQIKRHKEKLAYRVKEYRHKLCVGYLSDNEHRHQLKQKCKSDKRRDNSRLRLRKTKICQKLCQKSITNEQSDEIFKGTFPLVRLP